jgi:hypothetical protein
MEYLLEELKNVKRTAKVSAGCSGCGWWLRAGKIFVETHRLGSWDLITSIDRLEGLGFDVASAKKEMDY